MQIVNFKDEVQLKCSSSAGNTTLLCLYSVSQLHHDLFFLILTKTWQRKGELLAFISWLWKHPPDNLEAFCFVLFFLS